MSQPNSPRDDKVAGTLRVPSPEHTQAEIEAELRDHLATAADRLQHQGLPPAAAQQKAQENFGDVASITRRCYWIKQGDAVMFRWAIIGLLSILCVGLAITMLGSWRSQTQMAAEMRALAEQLKALAQTQAAVPAVPAPLEITGKVYLSTPEKPATNTEVMICRVGDGEIVRRIATDQSGDYRSGPLAEGDYTVLAKEPKDARAPRLGFQSAPAYLYPGTPKTSRDLDVGHPKGQIAVELSEPLPKLEVEGKYVIDSRLYLRVDPRAVRRERWTAKSNMPEYWPLYIHSPEATPNPPEEERRSRSDLRSYIVLSNGDLSAGLPVNFLGSGELLTAGPYQVTAVVVADIKPFDYSDDVVNRPQSGFYGDGQASMRWMSHNWIMGGYMGRLWESKLRSADSGRPMGGSSSGRFSPWSLFSADSTVELRAGMLTRLKVEIPSDVVSRIQNLADTITGHGEFVAAVTKEQPFIRSATVTVVGSEPAIENEKGRPSSASE